MDTCNTQISPSFRFEINKDNEGTLNNNNELLNTEERAEEYSVSAFLDNAFIPNKISFRTHITDINLNDTLNINGLDYLVTDINTSIVTGANAISIGAKRYD